MAENEKTESATATVAKTHNALERFSDRELWSGHGIGVLIIALGVILVILSKGPSWRDAVDAFNESKRKK